MLTHPGCTATLLKPETKSASAAARCFLAQCQRHIWQTLTLTSLSKSQIFLGKRDCDTMRRTHGMGFQVMSQCKLLDTDDTGLTNTFRLSILLK